MKRDCIRNSGISSLLKQLNAL